MCFDESGRLGFWVPWKGNGETKTKFKSFKLEAVIVCMDMNGEEPSGGSIFFK